MARLRLNRKIIFAVLVVIVIVAVAWWQISLSRGGVTIETSTVTKDDIEIFVSAPARVTLPSRADLSFKTGGKIAALRVKKGDTVIAGQVLAELDLTSINPQIRQAEAGLKIAQAGLSKLRSGRSRREIAVAEASVDQAVTAVASARRSLKTVNKIVDQSKKRAAFNVSSAEEGVYIANKQLSKAQAGARTEERNVASSQLNQAQQSLNDAQANYDKVSTLNTKMMDEANQALTSAEATFQHANTVFASTPDTDPAYNAVKSSKLQAEAARDGATVAKERLSAQNSQSLQAAQSQVNAAQKAYDTAYSQYYLATAGSRTEDLQIISSQLRQAEIALQIAQMGKDDASLEAQIDAAQGQLDSAIKSSQVAIAQLQLQKEGARAADVSAAQGQIEQAQAALTGAEAIADDAVLRAPFSGQVAAVNGKAGEIAGLSASVAAATGGSGALITLINFDRLELSADVDETEIGKVKTGQAVRIILDAYEDKVFEGKLTNISIISSKNATGGTIFTVTIVANPVKELFREGMGGDVDIIAQSKKNVVTIPFDAVKLDGKKASVFVIKNGIAKKRDIKLGLTSDIAYEVVDGLKEEEVVAVGKTDLKDGDQVKVNDGGRIGQ
ncbi:MAG: efflux RND transporter periplasmic adaptor subunit [Actinomycetota bacterium]|nr:efflux RND transporter periplasmic adaptor subunit [Actinomycetota bacterium]